MDREIILIYCICVDFLKLFSIKDDPQCKMNTAEIMTVVIISALYFGGNHALARRFLKAHHYIPNMLSESHFNRRWHAIDIDVWHSIFGLLGNLLNSQPQASEYVIDSFPVAVCENARSYRCKLLSGKHFIGYCAAKKKYYYGLKVHVITSVTGQLVEFMITHASTADITALKMMSLDLPNQAVLYADRAYIDYRFEDFLEEIGIRSIPQRKKSSKRQHNGPLAYLQSIMRKRIETVFSQITALFPRFIHAVTSRGFILKLVVFIVTFSIKQML